MMLLPVNVAKLNVFLECEETNCSQPFIASGCPLLLSPIEGYLYRLLGAAVMSFKEELYDTSCNVTGNVAIGYQVALGQNMGVVENYLFFLSEVQRRK